MQLKTEKHQNDCIRSVVLILHTSENKLRYVCPASDMFPRIVMSIPPTKMRQSHSLEPVRLPPLPVLAPVLAPVLYAKSKITSIFRQSQPFKSPTHIFSVSQKIVIRPEWVFLDEAEIEVVG